MSKVTLTVFILAFHELHSIMHSHLNYLTQKCVCVQECKNIYNNENNI